MTRLSVFVFHMAALSSSAALGQVTLFTDLSMFEQAVADAGKMLKGTEDFEESNVPHWQFAGPLADPLEGGVPNLDPFGLGFPDGLSQFNLVIQSNALGVGARVPFPGEGLRATGEMDGTGPTTMVGAHALEDSTDLIFPLGDKTAVGFDVLLEESPVLFITAFDTNGAQIFEDLLFTNIGFPGPFVGLLSTVPIGRINVADFENGSEMVDNIRLYVPEPTSVSLLALGTSVLMRRRHLAGKNTRCRRRYIDLEPENKKARPRLTGPACCTASSAIPNGRLVKLHDSSNS